MALDKEQLDALRIDPAQRSSGRGFGRFAYAILAIIGLAVAVYVGTLLPGKPDAQAPAIETALALRPSSGQGAVLDASGYVVARRIATVSSKVTGRVEAVLIEEGMQVEEGQLLARLDASSVRPLVELAESQLRSSRRGLEETEVRLAEARRQLQRTAKLRDDKLVSIAALDAAESEVNALTARLRAVRASVEVAQRSLEVQKQQLEDLQIKAPFAGVIISKNAQPGEMISPVSAGGGFTRTGIGTIVDMDSREIEVDVNEAYINRVSDGQRVIATLDAYKEWDIPATVINIVPAADRQRATVKVRISFNDLDPRILPDMGVKVRFLENEIELDGNTTKALALVPRSAVRTDGNTQFVWLVTDGIAERRAVSTGRKIAGNIEITAGLSPGDRVVTTTEIELVDGKEVGG